MNLKNYSQVHRLTAIAFILALALVPTANAADGTWTGGTSATWATTSNWLNGISPGTTDTAIFNSASYLFSPSATSNLNLGNLLFNSGNTGALTITTSASANRLNLSGGIQMNAGSGVVLIGAASSQGISLLNNVSFANNSSSLLTVRTLSVDDSVLSGTATVTLNGSGSGGTTFGSGGLIDGATAKLALNVNTTGGATVLSVANTYTGGTTLTQGNLLLGNNTALGTGSLALNGGKLSSSATTSQAPANSTTIGGNVTLGDAVNNGKLTFSGTMGLGEATRTLTTDSVVEFTGVVGGGGGITKQGASTLTFLGASANIYTGTTTVNHGTLVLAKTAGVNAIAGGLTIGDGTNSDTVNLGASDQIADTVVVNMIGTASGQRGNFQLLGFNETIGGLSGGGQVQNASSTADSVLTLNVANATTQTSSAVLRNTGGSTTGSLSIVKTGGGTQILGGNMTYTGVTSINQGTLAVTGSLLNTGSVLVNDGGSLSGSGSVGAVTLASGSLLRPGGSPGILTAASSIWQAGSTYSWEIDSNESAAEVGTNWDLFSVTGALDMSALKSTTQMNLVLNSLPGFDLASSERREWVIAQAGSLLGTGGAVLIAGANVSDYFSINASAFNAGTPSLVNEWRIKVGDTGKTLNLMAIPEPSTGTLLGFGLGGLLLTRLLRRKQS